MEEKEKIFFYWGKILKSRCMSHCQNLFFKVNFIENGWLKMFIEYRKQIGMKKKKNFDFQQQEIVGKGCKMQKVIFFHHC